MQTITKYIGVVIFALFAQFSIGQTLLNGLGGIEYSNPKTYEIGGITIDGVQHLDANAIILLSGLTVGDEITVPGDQITKALRNLWKQKLFSDIKIYATKIVGNTIFLSIKLEERPRLSKFVFKGVSKSQADNLRESIHLIRGKIVTENLITNTENIVRNYFIGKGYLNTKVDISQKIDTLINNSIILTITVDRGSRVKIKEITFHGNNSIKAGKLKKAMRDTKEKSPFRIFSSSKFIESDYKTDKAGVIAKYNEEGYRDAKIVTDTVYVSDKGKKKKTVNIEITVEEGNRFYFRNITFVGNTKYTSAQLHQILGIEKGDVFNQAELETKVYINHNGRDISGLYQDDGYLSFQIEPVEVYVENDSIDFEIRMNEGKRYRVRTVSVIGNVKTNDHVIMREIRTRPGDLFNRSDIIRTQRELSQIGLFDPEKLSVNPTPNPQDATVDLEYIVEEKPIDQIELSGAFGAGRIVGTLGFSLNNFSIKNAFKKGGWQPTPAGDGQKLSIRAQANGLFIRSYTLSFTEPWLGGKKPNSLTVSANHMIQSNGVKRFITDENGDKVTNPDRRDIKISRLAIGYGRKVRWPDDYFSYLIEGSYSLYNLNNYGTLFNFSEGRANNISAQFVVQRNSTDQLIYPRLGSSIKFSVKASLPYSLFDGIDDYTPLSDAEKYKWVEYHKWKFTSSWFTTLSGNGKLVLNTRAGFGFLGFYNSQIGQAPFERFYLGGVALNGWAIDGREIIALRGYDDLSLSSNTGSSIISKYTAEIRYPLSLNPTATVFGLAFAEAGNTWEEFKDFNPFEVKRSAGIGVRIFLPMFGMLGLDYGVGFDEVELSPLFQPGTGQFHFSIGMNFGEL